MQKHTLFLLAPLLGVGIVLSGCAASSMRGTAPVPPTDAEIADAAVPLRCSSQAQCDRWWRASQVWVVNASSLKLQIATDAVLQTYSSTGALPYWAFTITRSPIDGGRESIEIRVDCVRGYVCTPVQEAIVADYKRTILGVR